jgi:hypothetical protein
MASGRPTNLDGNFVVHSNDDTLSAADVALGYKQLQNADTLMAVGLVSEHLSSVELSDFLDLARRVLSATGLILISAPVEIGPALLLKDLHRFALRARPSEHGASELVKASIFGIAARRAEEIKEGHRGYDFRKTMAQLGSSGCQTRVLRYGPLPIPGWYGNSQVYMTASRLLNPTRDSEPTTSEAACGHPPFRAPAR